MRCRDLRCLMKKDVNAAIIPSKSPARLNHLHFRPLTIIFLLIILSNSATFYG